MDKISSRETLTDNFCSFAKQHVDVVSDCEDEEKYTFGYEHLPQQGDSSISAYPQSKASVSTLASAQHTTVVVWKNCVQREALLIWFAVARVQRRRLLDLDGGVVDALEDEVALSRVQRSLGVVRHQVHTQGRESRAQRPDVQVVHRHHGGALLQAALDLVGVDAVGRTLHEHVDAVAHDADGGGQHQHREDEGGDGVGDLPLGLVPNERAGHAHADALNEVAERVDVGGLDVEVLQLLLGCLCGQSLLEVSVGVAVGVAVAVAVAVRVAVAFLLTGAGAVSVAMAVTSMAVSMAAAAVTVSVAQDLHQDEVHEEADAGHNEHELAVHVLLGVGLQALHEALHGGVDEHAREHPDDQHGGDGANDLRALEAEAQAVGGRQRADPDGEERDAEARHVRQQVRGVRHDGQTAGQEAAHHLGAHEEQRAHAGQLQLALRALGAVRQRDAARAFALHGGRRALERHRLVHAAVVLARHTLAVAAAGRNPLCVNGRRRSSASKIEGGPVPKHGADETGGERRQAETTYLDLTRG
ncbi:unnamed protein product [Phytophthora lilii]|uniref:Unnamed protein product n=1 Tax=Phytophthora lilii TaxID=2077276 RepID=A0A9W6TPI8_9STRA|nr:unnamed protein product [Phytophthora lilii]